MLTFSQSITNRLNKTRGEQPILLLEIDWVALGTAVYSDIDYPGATASIISVGSLDRLIQQQVSNSISVVLDSTDEVVESIFRSHDVHLRPVRLYLTFPGETDRVLLFSGLINSQVSWDEAGRTLQFDVLNKLEDSLVGFSMEDGNFPAVSEDDRGKVWPLPFGSVCHYQAQRLSTTIKGFLLEGVGAVDPTLSTRICQIEKTTCPTITRPVLKAGPLPNSAIISEDIVDPNCLARKRNEGCILKDLLSRQQALAASSFTVRGGEQFPQNRTIRIRVGVVQFTGVMTGTTFAVQNVFHPDVDKVSQCRNVRPPTLGFRYTIGSEAEANSCSNQGHSANTPPVPGVDCITATSFGVGGNFYSSCGFGAGGTTLQQQVNGGSADSWRYYDQMPTGRFLWSPAGTDVVLTEYSDDIIFMVSLVPGVVTQVLAYRQFGDQKLLSQVPTEWYTVQNTNYGGYQCVELRFNTLPSTTDQPGWEDDIIVSFTSSVGPSPVDIIQWLVETYTDFTVNASNFASVKATLSEFKTNFVVQDRPNVLKLIEDIAYQQRMALRIVGNEVSLVYLAKEPTSLKLFDSSDIVQGSFRMSYTETEELRTNHKISWKPEYIPNVQGEKVEKDLQIRFNIPKYGSTTETQNWYSQNTFDTINKNATFWLIRKSNTWLQVEFETTIEHLDLDVLDCITLSIVQFPTTKVVIQSKRYDSETNTVKWTAWTPIRAGESLPFYWAWPATVTTGVWPIPTDGSQVGDGSGLVVVPPVGHPLRVGYVAGDSVPVSTGDKFPSDVGFLAPVVTCTVPLGNEVVFAQTPIIDPLAKQQFQDSMQQKTDGGVSITWEKEDKPCSFSGFNPCPFTTTQIGDQSSETPVDEKQCRYEVALNYVLPDLIRNNGCAGPCGREVGRVGMMCSGSFFTVTSYVTNFEAAQSAVTKHNADRKVLNDNCNYTYQVAAPAAGATIRTYTSTSTYTNVKAPSNQCNPEDDNLPLETLYQPTANMGLPNDQPIPEPL